MVLPSLVMSVAAPQGIKEGFDKKKILKALKKEYCCNGTVVEDEELGFIIQVQGDQRKNIADFLTTVRPCLGMLAWICYFEARASLACCLKCNNTIFVGSWNVKETRRASRYRGNKGLVVLAEQDRQEGHDQGARLLEPVSARP